MQFARSDSKKSPSKELLLDYGEKRSRSSSKFWQNRQDLPEFNTIAQTSDFNIKKRPQSNSSIKVRKNSSQGLNKSGKCGESKMGSTAGTNRPLIGTIKSNLFIPHRLIGRNVF